MVAYRSWESAQESVRAVIAQLRQETSSRIEEKLNNYTEIPHTLNSGLHLIAWRIN
ncbi:MAG: hypothetical protein ACK4QL_07780 [Pseudanabaenaceae cyanobacterium]